MGYFRTTIVRLGGSISTVCLSVGCTVLLACSMLLAQTHSGRSAEKKSRAKVQATSAHPTAHRSKKTRKSAKSRKRGQQKIDSARVREIQEALIREHYLTGTASGTWDARSQSAMQRYQADNGWQSKSVPDSRALIKLGLGPNHDHLLNPESAMTSPPESLRAEPMLEQTSTMANRPQK